MRREDETIAVIGAGRVGTALGVRFARAGYRIGGVFCRTEEQARRGVARIGAGRAATDPGLAAAGATVVVIAVPDRAIRSVVDTMARSRFFCKTDVIVHTSGALAADVLRTAGTEQALLGSMHPVQTIADRISGSEALVDAYYGLEGDAEAVARMRGLVAAVEGKALIVRPGTKALYHAAACVASNYFVALMDGSLALYEAAGIRRDEAWPVVEALVRETLHNAKARGIPDCLTGPVERADVATVQAHLDAMADADGPDGADGMGGAKDVTAVYRALGAYTAALARQKGDGDGAEPFSQEAFSALMRLFYNIRD